MGTCSALQLSKFNYYCGIILYKLCISYLFSCRVSVPRSVLQVSSKYRPHRRRSFDSTDSMGLSKVCQMISPLPLTVLCVLFLLDATVYHCGPAPDISLQLRYLWGWVDCCIAIYLEVDILIACKCLLLLYRSLNYALPPSLPPSSLSLCVALFVGVGMCQAFHGPSPAIARPQSCTSQERPALGRKGMQFVSIAT